MNRLKEIILKVVESFTKGSIQTKVIIVGIAVAVIGVIAFTITYSSPSAETILFNRALTEEEFSTFTTELEKLKIDYKTRDNVFILFEDDKTRQNAVTRLTVAGTMPNTVKGWELFDMQSWTTTEFDRNINLIRALEGEIKQHIESLEWIESARVRITMPEKKLYTSEAVEPTAAVTIMPAPSYYDYLKNRQLIKGVQQLVQKGVDNLKEENITITDHTGLVLETELDESIKTINQIKAENKIVRQQRLEIEKKLRENLRGLLSDDRYKVAASLELSFDRLQENRTELLPMVVKERTPGLPYDDSVIVEKVPVSDKRVKEDFKGQGFIPEGPPGVEPNIPPGYKEIIDKWNTYSKTEDINNWETGKKIVEMINDGQDILKKTVSVTVDGTWEKELDESGDYIWEKDHFRRKYIPYPLEDLKKLEELIKNAIGFDAKRGDSVAVKNIQFDRAAQFLGEDEKYRKQRQTRMVLLVALVALFCILIISVIFIQVRKEIMRRRRIKERELQRQRQMQRDEALRALDTEAPAETMSEADRKRQEMQERADQMAVERPQDVAKLIRSWLAEDN